MGFTQGKPDSFSVQFVLNAHDFQLEWARCSLLADYIARYFSYQFSGNHFVENLISTGVNDILEFTINTSDEHAYINIHCIQDGGNILMEIGYILQARLVEAYQNFIHLLSQKKIQDIYRKLITDSPPPEESFGQFSIVWVLQDLMAQFKAKVNQSTGETYAYVILPVKDTVI